MKRLLTIALFFFVASTLQAGPLDRTSEPRTNPAVDNMLRIPGVVGLSQQEALITLQQAGLNPIMRPTRTPNIKYQGLEGKVVSQTPNPGGVAMIGSSVTIHIYLPPGYSETPAATGETWSGDAYGGTGETWYDDTSGGYSDQDSDYQSWSAEESEDSSSWGGEDTPQFIPTEMAPQQWQKVTPADTSETEGGGQPLQWKPQLKPVTIVPQPVGH